MSRGALFRSGPNLGFNACVGKNGGPYTFYAYSRGYFHAVERLVESIENKPSSLDVLVYPLIFLGRHGVELSLKHLASVLPLIWDQPSQYLKSHNILKNWEIVKGYLVQRKEFDPDGTGIPYVENTIIELQGFDPLGEKFRYPSDKKGKRYLQETSVVNIQSFANQIIDVSFGFDFWSHIVDELLDLKWEFYRP